MQLSDANAEDSIKGVVMKIFFLGQKVKNLKPVSKTSTYEINGRTESSERVFPASQYWTVNGTPNSCGLFEMISYTTPLERPGMQTPPDWTGTQEEAEEMFEPIWLSLDVPATV